MGSHLSSVHVLEVLSKAQSFFGVDPGLLESIKRWVQLRQEEDGSFTPLAADIKISLLTIENEVDSTINKKNSASAYEELDYGIVEKWKNLSKEVLNLERSVEITADTLATLLEVGVENEVCTILFVLILFYYLLANQTFFLILLIFQLDADTVLKAKIYLEKNLNNVSSSYPLAAMVYALVLSQ